MGVVDVSCGVVGGDQTGLDVCRELGTPQKGWNVGVRSGGKPNPTHAGAGGIMSANGDRVIWDKLRNFCGAGGQGLGEMLKVSEHIVHLGGDTDSVLVGMSEALLQKGEEAPGAWDTNGHTPKLPKYFVPESGGNAILESQGVKEVVQTLNAMWRELKGLADCINNPAQYHLSGAEVSIPLKKLLHGGNMLPVWWIGRVQWAENSIDAVKQTTEVGKASLGGALAAEDKIINVHVSMPNRFGEGPQDRRCWGNGSCRGSGILRRGL